MTSREKEHESEGKMPLMSRVQGNHSDILRQKTNQILDDESSRSGNNNSGRRGRTNGNLFNHTGFPSPTFDDGNDEESSYYYDIEKTKRANAKSNFQNNKTSSYFSEWMPSRGSDTFHRNRGGYSQTQTASDLVFRSTNSTRRAMRELEQRRYEATQRKKASSLSLVLIAVTCAIYYVSNSNYNIGLTLQNQNMNVDDDKRAAPALAQIRNSTISFSSDQVSSENALNDFNKLQNQNGEQSDFDNDNEPTPEEEVIEPGKEFLQPYRYFADLSTPTRKTDSNFFFHIPRSGGQTIKDVVGKCLQKTLASEVGVRDGHGQDDTLQVVDFNGANYVNVDTTSIDGLHRSAAMGLAASGLSDLIASSYFGEVGMLFDLHHKGRAFILLRDPMVRAVSMYYYKTQGENPTIDSGVSIEDYAQGNGIENSK